MTLLICLISLAPAFPCSIPLLPFVLVILIPLSLLVSIFPPPFCLWIYALRSSPLWLGCACVQMAWILYISDQFKSSSIDNSSKEFLAWSQSLSTEYAFTNMEYIPRSLICTSPDRTKGAPTGDPAQTPSIHPVCATPEGTPRVYNQNETKRPEMRVVTAQSSQIKMNNKRECSMQGKVKMNQVVKS